jgi:hypothetical protein
VVYGTGLTALAQGALVGIGFAIAQLPSPIVFGVLAAICALLPAGGAALVWAPGALWLFATGEWGWGVFMLVWGAIVSVSDNLIRPIAIRTHAEVSTLAVFVGVVGGVAAFGTIGVILGPVLLTLVVSLLGYIDATQLPSRQRCSATCESATVAAARARGGRHRGAAPHRPTAVDICPTGIGIVGRHPRPAPHALRLGGRRSRRRRRRTHAEPRRHALIESPPRRFRPAHGPRPARWTSRRSSRR